MRPSLLLFGFFVACTGSLRERDCAKNPENCDHEILRFNNTKDTTEQVGMDQDLLENLRFFSQFAAASYWPGNNNSTGDLLRCSSDSCPAGNCPDVEKGNYMTISEWNDVARFGNHGFIAISQISKLIVLSFRGTGSHQNWVQDFKIDKVDVPDFCDGCKVHHGFWELWRSVSEDVTKILIRLHDENPDCRVIVVGHSLGGAEAILAAGEIRKQGSWWIDNVEVYSYGSPRVGNIETVKFLSQQSTKSYRVTAMQDPTPRLPMTLFGYQHTSPEYWIHSNPDNPGPDDVNVLRGYFNPNGVNKFSIFSDGFHMDYHRHYFGYISGCDPDPPNYHNDLSAEDVGSTL